MSEMFEAAEELLEETFPPKPGGLVDRHRTRIANEKARQAEQENIDERVEERSYRAVKVAPESPEIFAAQTITLLAGATAMVLPMSMYRYRALVVASASGVILAKDSSAALGMAGFPAPTGVALPLHTRAQVWAYNSTNATVTVGVIAEIYAPEDGN